MEYVNYKIVKYSPEFKSQILELQKHHLSPDMTLNAAYLDWKYERNPYINANLIYVALCAGQMVGMIGAYGTEWQLGNPGKTLIVPCLGDAVIHPDHRNQGLYQKMTAFVLDDLYSTNYTYIFDLSARPELALGMLMRGWRSIGFLHTAHWQPNQSRIFGQLWKYTHKLGLFTSAYLRVRGYAQRLATRNSDKQDHPFDALDRNSFLRQTNTTPPVAVERSPHPGKMAELVERVSNDGRLQHVRNEQFFSWRFKNPLARYRFLFWDDVSLEGYLCLQAPISAPDGKKSVNILDWEATSEQVRAHLLRSAICWGDFDQLTIWSETLSDNTKALLKKMGFDFVHKTGRITRDIYHSKILIRSVRDEMSPADWVLANRALLDLANWDLRMIYSDAY